MGKKKDKGEYNDFLDGEKLRDNAAVRTTLQAASNAEAPISPPPSRQDRKRGGKKGKGGPKKPSLTHFLCLPLVNEQSRPHLAAALDTLKASLEEAGTVPLAAVRPVGTLHLTLGVMALDAAHLAAATQYLEELDLRSLLRDAGAVAEPQQVADDEALCIDLAALVPMQAPHKTSILYAEPRDGSQRLRPFSVALRERFVERGLMVEDKRELRLHATVVNTVYAKKGERQGRGRGKGKTERQARGEGVGVGEQGDDASTTVPMQEAGEQGGVPLDQKGDEARTGSAGEREERAEGHGPDAKSWLRFDARELIEKHSGVLWAEGVRIDRVQICKMGAKKIVGEDGEVVDEKYEVVAEKRI